MVVPASICWFRTWLISFQIQNSTYVVVQTTAMRVKCNIMAFDASLTHLIFHILLKKFYHQMVLNVIYSELIYKKIFIASTLWVHKKHLYCKHTLGTYITIWNKIYTPFMFYEIYRSGSPERPFEYFYHTRRIYDHGTLWIHATLQYFAKSRIVLIFLIFKTLF